MHGRRKQQQWVVVKPQWNLTAKETQLAENLQVDDDEPVESVAVRRQMDLLVSTLYDSWKGPGTGRTFMACSNVGVFFSVYHPPIVPTVFVCVDPVESGRFECKNDNAYFLWHRKKAPTVAIESINNIYGGDRAHKLLQYAEIGVQYLVFFDPYADDEKMIVERFSLQSEKYEPMADCFFDEIGLGLALWQGEFQGLTGTWLRWFGEPNGDSLIPTASERLKQIQDSINKSKQ